MAAQCMLFDIAVVKYNCVCADAVGCADWFACGCVVEGSLVTCPMDDAVRPTRDNCVVSAGGCVFTSNCGNSSRVFVVMANFLDLDSCDVKDCSRHAA